MTSFLLLAALRLAAPAAADWQDIPAGTYALRPPQQMPLYPQDLAILFQWQRARTPVQCAQAGRMLSPAFLSIYRESGLSPRQLAAAAPLLDAVSAYTSAVTGILKKIYPRARPFAEDARLRPCISTERLEGRTAYPSTHAAAAAVDACVLGQIFPERAPQLARWGAWVGELRVITGVHHPSDVQAGQELAAQICPRLLSQPDFMEQLRRTAGEARAAR